jgi:hypothetical protein
MGLKLKLGPNEVQKMDDSADEDQQQETALLNIKLDAVERGSNGPETSVFSKHLTQMVLLISFPKIMWIFSACAVHMCRPW